MKRILALLLAGLLTTGSCPVTAPAADEGIKGDMGVEDSIFGVIEQVSLCHGRQLYAPQGSLYF